MAGEVSRSVCARAGVVLVLGALFAGVASASASAASGYAYSVVVCAPTESCTSATPAVTGLNAAGATLTVKITNLTSATLDPGENGAINDFTLTAPAGFTIVSCPSGCGGATVSSGSVKFSGLNLLPNASATLTLTVNTPSSGCTVASACTWATSADYDTGDSDADDSFALDASTSSVNTVLARWAFTATGQPTSAQIGATITNSPYNTPPGSAVAVQAVDSTGAPAPQGGSVSLSLNPSPAALGGTTTGTYSGTPVNFSPTVSAAGYNYALTASSPAGAADIPSATSNNFDIHTAVSATQCTGTGCSGSTTNGNGTLGGSSSSTSGQLLLALDPSPGFWTTAPVIAACHNYTFLSGNQDTIQLTGPGGSVTLKDMVTLPVANLFVLAKTWITQQFCLAAGSPFTVAGGGTAAPVTLPDGSPGYAGLLPSLCFLYPGQPCVTKRTFKIVTLKPLVVTFEIDVSIPASLAGDPVGRR